MRSLETVGNKPEVETHFLFSVRIKSEITKKPSGEVSAPFLASGRKVEGLLLPDGQPHRSAFSFSVASYEGGAGFRPVEDPAFGIMFVRAKGRKRKTAEDVDDIDVTAELPYEVCADILSSKVTLGDFVAQELAKEYERRAALEEGPEDGDN